MISFDDFVDVAGIEKKIANLIALNEKFGDSVVAQNERARVSMVELKTELLGYKAELTGLTGVVTGTGRGLSGLKDGVAGATKAYKDHEAVLARNKQLLDLNTASITAIRARMRDLKTEYDSLDRTQAGSQARMKAIKSETDQVNTVLKSLTLTTKQAKQSVDAAEGSYARLDQQTKKLRADLMAMPNAFDAVTGRVNKNNQAAREMLARIDANDKALKKMDASMGIHSRNVGNYGGALKQTAEQMLGIGSTAAIVTTAFAAISAGVSIIQDMERYDAGLKAVSRDSADFARTQQFLLRESDKLGIEYGILAESFRGLKAATKDTNLEGKNTEKIFSAVATAGAKLQLSGETVQGTLLALTQMISKGHIQAEELRGQLGERLPGALRLMSEALGVSETKLNKMMEQGELIATEVLPQFADQLDKTFGLKQGEQIETISANMSRLKTEGALVVKEFNNSGVVNSFFAAITNGFKTSLGDVRRWVKDGSVQEFFTFFGANSLANANQRRRNVEDASGKFSGMDAAARQKELQRLAALEKKQRGEQGFFSFGTELAETSAIRRKLFADDLKLRVAEMKEAKRTELNTQKTAIEKNEADLTRFQKQAVRKRTAELLALEKEVAANPKDEIKAKKLEVYTKLDADQRAKDKAVSDRLKSQKPAKANDDTELEKIDKQIKSIEKTLQTQAMADLKAGRLIDVDPKLTEKVTKLKEQYEAIKAMQEAIEKGTYNTKISYDVSEIKPGGALNELTAGNKKGQALTPAETEAASAKQLAKFGADMARQTGIMSEYESRRQALAFQTENRLKGLRDNEKAEIRGLLNLQEEAERAGNQTEVQNLQRVIDQKKALYEKDYQNRKAVRDKSIEIGSALVNGLFELEQTASQNRMTQLDKEKERELANVGDNASAKAAIEAKYDAQRKQLQHQQDVQARNQALFNIAVNTAVEVSKVLSQPWLAVAIGILGAVQAGIVLAKPLPQYEFGKNVDNLDSYAGPAIAGEAGRELWIHNNKVDLLDKPSLINVGRNDTILPNYLTERLLNDERASEANAILSRIRAGQRAGDQLAANRDTYQAQLLSRAMAGNGSGGSSAGIEKAISKGFEKAEVHQWKISNGQLTEWVAKQNSQRTVQAKKHQLGK